MPFFSSLASRAHRRGIAANSANPGGNPQQSPYDQVGAIASNNLSPYATRGNEAYSSALPDQLFSQMLHSYQQAPNVRAGAQNPYTQNPYAENNVQPQFTQMADNPQNFLDAIMRNYSPSEGYRFRERRMLGAARNSASSGGRAGTGEDQLSQANIVRELMGQDQQEFLRNILGIQGAGLEGIQRAGEERRAGTARFGENQQGYQENQLQGAERHQARQLSGMENARNLWAQLAGNRNENRESRGYTSVQDLTQALMQNIMNAEGARLMQERQRQQRDDDARAREAIEQNARRERRDNRRRGGLGFLGQLGGAAIGGMMGGPTGAGTGASVGGRLGSLF